VVLLSLPGNAGSAFLGDINQDEEVNLQDSILGLQIVTGRQPAISPINPDTDVDKDGKIGLGEVMYALQAEINSGVVLQHQVAIFGPLSGAAITAFRADNLRAAIEGTKKANSSPSDLQVAGTFNLTLPGVADDDWIVVTAAKGEDIDADGDGAVDTTGTANLGTIHALAKASDWRTKNLKISPLTEIVWRYTENLVSTVPSDELEIRLNDLARYLIKTDIDGSGTIDWYDFLFFNPADQTHRDSLKTSYDWLTTEDADGNSIIGSLLAGDEEQMLLCMDETYSYLMTRFTVADSRYNSVKITLSVFGQGSAVSEAPYTLAVDSTTASPTIEDHVFLQASESDSIILTASAGTDSRILSWTGCDNISTDLSQCTVPLKNSQSVIVNFGKIDTRLKGTLHNLSDTTNYVLADAVTVFIPSDMTDMIDEMALAVVGDFIVGGDNGGFLRKITAITQNSSTEYVLTTLEAALDEVIAEGSGQLRREMTNGDLEGYTAPAGSTQSATISPTAFTGLAGVQLIPSNNPDDKTFRLILGQPNNDIAQSQLTKDEYQGSVVLYEKKNSSNETIAELSATGEVSLEISFDKGIDIDFNWQELESELQYLKFISIVTATQSVDFSATGELKTREVSKKLGSIPFKSYKFFIGAVPVWVKPSVDIYLYAEGSIEAQATFGVEFQQTIEGGFLYNRGEGFSLHKNFTSDFTSTPPIIGLEASIEGGIKIDPVITIYSATGPSIPLKAYAKIKGSASTEIHSGCSDVLVDFSAGAKAGFKWEFSGNTKFGKLLHLDNLEEKTKVNILAREWPIKEWTVLNNCPRGAHLLVEGVGIQSTIYQGDSSGLSTTLTISNDGDDVLMWNTSGIPTEVIVTPSLGELNPGEEEVVLLSINTGGLPAGRYNDKIFIYDEASRDSDLSDGELGNTYKAIDVTVLGTISSSPSLTTATSSSVGRASIGWDFSQTGSVPLTGFQIYATTTPADASSYQLVHTTNIYDRQETLTGLSPGSLYSFKVRALGVATVGPFSNPVSVNVMGIASSTIAGTVVSTTGRVWMDRNLGASRVATSSTDAEAYGDLYQWGRLTDGHEKRTSSTTSTLSSTDTPGHGSFILAPFSPHDWRTPQNNNLWQGVSGINNPCPSGFRLPTGTELDAERASWSSSNAAGAFASLLKLVVAGYRSFGYGTQSGAGSSGGYWSSTVNGSSSRDLIFTSDNAYMSSNYRAYGFSVRCLKD
jgi:uncharacterized protein (TIGR02145 family)